MIYREEKTEALLECKEELEYHKMLLTKLKQEVRHKTIKEFTLYI